MSQKSSDPQAISFVSQPLKRDTAHCALPCIVKRFTLSSMDLRVA
jgi:hypothetical protein